MKRFLNLLFTFCILSYYTNAQDVKYAHYIVDTLSSPFLYGRGYTNNGDKLAAEFIKNELIKNNSLSFNNNFFQEYKLSINSIKKTSLRINNKNISAGNEFLVSLSSPKTKGKFKVLKLDSTNFKSKKDYDNIIKKDLKKTVILIDKQNIKDKDITEIFNKTRFRNPFNSAGIITIADKKLSWAISDGRNVNEYFKISVLREVIPKKVKKISVDIDTEYLSNYTTNNVIGYVKGKLYPDSFIVFIAHYDHLGQMGENVYFPGANDNGSGTSMVLDLARHFAADTNKFLKYSIVFAFVSGEEAGLLGSYYLSKNPLFPIDKIKFLINLDMVGTGSEGITIVNGTKFEKEFQLFKEINDKNSLLKTVAQRGESCNSDHCPFYEKGVPAVFIYSMGSENTEYHNIYDTADKLPFTKYNEIFKLLTIFVDKL
jgi:hypothetical protein